MSDDEQLIDASSKGEEQVSGNEINKDEIGEKGKQLNKKEVKLRNDDDDEHVDFGCLGSGAACNPFKKFHRFLVLVLICLLSFGSYFCYDNPAALAPQFKNDLGLVVNIMFESYFLFLV